MAFEISPCRTTVVVGICDAAPFKRSLPDWVVAATSVATSETADAVAAAHRGAMAEGA